MLELDAMGASSRSLVMSWLVAGPLVVACHGDPAFYVRSTVERLGTQDLRCPPERLTTYLAASGVYVAQGCGAWTSYDCSVRPIPYSTDWDVICVPHAPQVHADPRPAQGGAVPAPGG